MERHSMHRCLAVPEILNAIFQYVRRLEKEGSATLARLAVTCKLFKEPALDILWYHLPSFNRLIGCLPSDILSKQRGGSFPRVSQVFHQLSRPSDAFLVQYHRLMRKLEPSDFGRICYYASKVQVLLGLDHPVRIDPVLLPVLTRNPNPGPLLPKLKGLTLSIEHFRQQAFFPRLVISSRLTSITVTLYGSSGAFSVTDYPWDNVEKVLMAHPMALESFKVHAKASFTHDTLMESDSPPALLQLVNSFKHLKVLDVPVLDADHLTLSYLGSLPDLQLLSISTSGANLALLVDAPFSTLKKLLLQIDDLLPCEAFFRFPRFQQLWSLKIQRAEVGRTWNIDQFFHRFRTGQSLPRLTSLDVSIPFKHHRPPNSNNITSSITLQTFGSLFPIANLDTLRISVDCAFNLNTDDLVKMGMGWPHLRVLELQDRTIHSAPSVRLAGLIPLLASCPNLEELALRVDAFQDIPDFAELDIFVPHSRLRKFNYCRSPIKEPRHVAAFLAFLLLSLSKLYAGRARDLEGDLIDFTEDPTELLYVKRWEEVEGIMKPLLGCA